MVFLEMLFSKLSDDGTNYQVRIMKRIPFSGRPYRSFNETTEEDSKIISQFI